MVLLICNPADGELSPLLWQLGLLNVSKKKEGMLLEATLGAALERPWHCGFATRFLMALPGHSLGWLKDHVEDGAKSAQGMLWGPPHRQLVMLWSKTPLVTLGDSSGVSCAL